MSRKSRKYKSVVIEAVNPDGTVAGIRNAFITENACCKGEDPKWPREKLIEYAKTVMARWNESYDLHTPVVLRVAH